MHIEFSPGPSQVYPKLPAYVNDALENGVLSLSHRSSQFADIYASTTSSLRELLGVPAEYHLWFMGSATEAMERIIQNTVVSTSHHFVNGAFSAKFASIARDLGIQPTATHVEWGEGFDLAHEKVPGTAELIAVTQNETSTGVSLDAAGIASLKRRYPEALIVVDIVSAVPQVTLDFRSIDCAFFSVQKGFGLPAGLGVLIASPRALERAATKRQSGHSIGSYHSFTELAEYEAKHNTPETPNVLGIYLLGRVAQDMLAADPLSLRERLATNADRLYRVIERHPLLTPAVAEPGLRSPTVVVACVHGEPAHLIEDIRRIGLTIGGGYGQQKATHIRIANFPAHLEHVDSLIRALDDHAASTTGSR